MRRRLFAVYRYGHFFSQRLRALAIATLLSRLAEELMKTRAEMIQIDPILRPFRTGYAGLYGAQVQLEVDTVVNLSFLRHPEQLLGPKILFEPIHHFLGTPGESKVIDRFGVCRKEAHGRTVLRRHVRNRRSIW